MKAYATMYFVKNMKKSVAFFRDIVGLKPRFEDDGWTEFELGGTALALHAAGDHGVTPGGNGTLIFQVDDIQKIVGRMKENRVEFVKDVQDIGCGLCADFKDLDGNVFGLYQHTQDSDKATCK